MQGTTPLLGWQGRAAQLWSARIPGRALIPCSWYQIPFRPRIFSTSSGFVTVQHRPGQGAFVLGKPKHFTEVGEPDLHLLLWVGLWGCSSLWKHKTVLRWESSHIQMSLELKGLHWAWPSLQTSWGKDQKWDWTWRRPRSKPVTHPLCPCTENPEQTLPW